MPAPGPRPVGAAFPMRNTFLFRINPFLAAAVIVGVFFAVLFSTYGLTRAFSAGEVMGRVEVSGTALGGLTRDQALNTMVGVEDEYLATTLNVSLDDETVPVLPPVTGFDIDEEAIVDEALKIGREGNASNQFLWWLSNIFSTNEVELTGSVDPEALEILFDQWDADVIGMPASLGSLELVDGVVNPVYPAPGTGVDRDAAPGLMLTAMLENNGLTPVLPTVRIIPKLSDADVDEALAEANQLLSGDIRLLYTGSEIVFTVEQLVEAYRTETIAEGAPQIINFFDPDIINRYLIPVRALFEAAPVNAEFVIEGDEIRVEPGLRGTRIDQNEAALRLYVAGISDDRTGQLALVEDADPEVTTEALESLGINHLVSSFTTYHRCCESRVTNIQTFADTVDGVIVLPGEEFSLNGHVGQRTTAGGYLPAGTIVAGELQDTVGGGVSQFATTIYNAIFWGGYEDIDHKPHSYYFSRYPEGIEATISWLTPDLVFRNNDTEAVLIDTVYSGDSITVRFFGDNDGRIVKGDQRSGNTNIEVIAEGGPNALWVEGEVSGRFARTSPREPRYKPNEALGVDEVIQTQSERGGWSVNVTRRILLGGATLVSTQEWTVRYSPTFAVFEVHPCMVPGQEETCPTTTTSTTTPPTTSTSAPPP